MSPVEQEVYIYLPISYDSEHTLRTYVGRLVGILPTHRVKYISYHTAMIFSIHDEYGDLYLMIL